MRHASWRRAKLRRCLDFCFDASLAFSVAVAAQSPENGNRPFSSAVSRLLNQRWVVFILKGKGQDFLGSGWARFLFLRVSPIKSFQESISKYVWRRFAHFENQVRFSNALLTRTLMKQAFSKLSNFNPKKTLA